MRARVARGTVMSLYAKSVSMRLARCGDTGPIPRYCPIPMGKGFCAAPPVKSSLCREQPECTYENSDGADIA